MTALSVKGGLVFSGGGARGAYQAGVLKGLAKIHKENPEINPFRIITGVSAGAINSTFMASQAEDFSRAAERLCELWGNLTPDTIYKVDSFSLFWNGISILRTLMFGGKGKGRFSGKQLSLLDTEPSRNLFANNINFDGIQRGIDNGSIDALALSSMDYGSSFGVTFVQGKPDLPMWDRADRFSVRTKITLEHVMASSAIPLFFPTVQVGERFYGDGCLRNTAPLSPAIRLGANRLIIIGVRKGFGGKPMLEIPAPLPGLGKILNTIVNSVLMDGMEMDLERMLRVNETLKKIPVEVRANMVLQPIESVYIKPSADIAEIAKYERARMPRSIRYLLSGLGSAEETSDILSYLLFEGSFCSKLIELGYNDCLARQEEIAKIFLA